MPADQTTSHVDFWATIRQAAADVEHGLNLRGKTLAKCLACNGKRHTEPSRTDHDAHGGYYVAAVDCIECRGRGRVEVTCSVEVELAAVQCEIDKLQTRERELRKRNSAAGAGGE